MDDNMTPCTCDVCTLISWVDEHLEEGATSHRAVMVLTEALWRIIAETEAKDHNLHQTLIDLGIDPHTLMMLRTSVKLASWEMSAAVEESQDPEAEPSPQTVLH